MYRCLLIVLFFIGDGSNLGVVENCERSNGDICLCGIDIMPPILRFPLTFPPELSQEDIDQYKSAAWDVFVPSMNGPNQLSPCRGQSLFDYDHDNDVDLHDFAEFQARYRAPVVSRLGYLIETLPANGKLKIGLREITTVPFQLSDNSVIYDPNTGFSGVDSFTYKVNDGFMDSNIAIVNIHVE